MIAFCVLVLVLLGWAIFRYWERRAEQRQLLELLELVKQARQRIEALNQIEDPPTTTHHRKTDTQKGPQ